MQPFMHTLVRKRMLARYRVAASLLCLDRGCMVVPKPMVPLGLFITNLAIESSVPRQLAEYIA